MEALAQWKFQPAEKRGEPNRSRSGCAYPVPLSWRQRSDCVPSQKQRKNVRHFARGNANPPPLGVPAIANREIGVPGGRLTLNRRATVNKRSISRLGIVEMRRKSAAPLPRQGSRRFELRAIFQTDCAVFPLFARQPRKRTWPRASAEAGLANNKAVARQAVDHHRGSGDGSVSHTVFHADAQEQCKARPPSRQDY